MEPAVGTTPLHNPAIPVPALLISHPQLRAMKAGVTPQGTTLNLPPLCLLAALLLGEAGCPRPHLDLGISRSLSISKVNAGYSGLHLNDMFASLCVVYLFQFLCYTFISPFCISLLKVEKADVADDISQGSECKSDSNGQSSTPGLDSDHDYTIIGSSSPTHTEDRWVKLCFSITVYPCIYPD